MMSSGEASWMGLKPKILGDIAKKIMANRWTATEIQNASRMCARSRSSSRRSRMWGTRRSPPESAASRSAARRSSREDVPVGVLGGLTMDDIRMDQVCSSSTTSAPLGPPEVQNFPGRWRNQSKPGRLQQVSSLYFRIFQAYYHIHPKRVMSSINVCLHWRHESRHR